MKPKTAKNTREPHSANGPLARLRQLRADLPPTAKRIAAYLESHAKDVIRMSITEVAEQTDASEGSIVSLCRRLGAGGFQAGVGIIFQIELGLTLRTNGPQIEI